MQKQKEFGATIGPAGVDQDVLRSLRRIFHAVDHHSRRLARLYGLTEPQAICLAVIDRGAQMTPGRLARSVSLSPPTVTGILDRLERRGLIKRERTARDKRQVVVCLTNAGRRLLSSCPPPLQDRFTPRFSELPLSRQRRIAKALQELVTLMEADDIDAAPLLARGAANPAHAPDTLPFPNTGEAALDIPGSEH